MYLIEQVAISTFPKGPRWRAPFWTCANANSQKARRKWTESLSCERNKNMFFNNSFQSHLNTKTGKPRQVSYKTWLVVSTPSEKYARQNGFIFPDFRVKNKKYLSCHHLKTHPYLPKKMIRLFFGKIHQLLNFSNLKNLRGNTSQFRLFCLET